MEANGRPAIRGRDQRAPVRLVDVAAGRTRGHLAGDTAKANVGRTVTPLFRGRPVGTAVVATNGTFATTVALPPATSATPTEPASRVARAKPYQAVLGPLRSLNLKLARRMRTTQLSSRAGTVTIAGRVTNPPAPDTCRTVTVRQYKDCTGTALTVVKRQRQRLAGTDASARPYERPRASPSRTKPRAHARAQDHAQSQDRSDLHSDPPRRANTPTARHARPTPTARLQVPRRAARPPAQSPTGRPAASRSPPPTGHPLSRRRTRQ